MIGHPEVIVASGAPSYHRRLAWVCGYALRTSSMCELGDGVCRSGWLHGQEWLCYWGGAAICEIAAGSCGGGWLHSQEWLCYKVKTSNRFRRRWWSSWTRASPWDERPVLP